jgi:hypothetical protein
VAIDAGFHSRGDFLDDGVPFGNRAMASAAFDACFTMPRVAEEDEIRNRINLIRRKRLGVVSHRRQTLDLGTVLFHGAVARHALRHRWERGALAGLDRGVAIVALDLQRRMPLVAEVDGILRRGRQRYGKVKATSESE